MTQFDRMTLGRQAKELGFVRDTFEKVCRLANVLSFMEKDSLLANTLALKGGTAINFTIFSLPRLSVDIDLDFLKNLPSEEMKEHREKISMRIEKHMSTSGYTLSKKSKNPYALSSAVYQYVNAGGMKDNLKIEINYMMRAHVLPTSRREVNLPWLETKETVLALHPIEIYASKIVALMNRAAPRDLYDVYLMLKNHLFRKSEIPLLRKCVMFYSAIGSDAVPEKIAFDTIGQMTQNKIKTDLAPVLVRGEYFDLGEVRDAVVPFLENILIPEEKELQFWNEFRQQRYHPELLFDDATILSRIADHPMAVWKTRERESQRVVAEEKPSILAKLHEMDANIKSQRSDSSRTVRKRNTPER